MKRQEGGHQEAKVQRENRIQVEASKLGRHYERPDKKGTKEFKMSMLSLKGKWNAQQRRAHG